MILEALVHLITLLPDDVLSRPSMLWKSVCKSNFFLRHFLPATALPRSGWLTEQPLRVSFKQSFQFPLQIDKYVRTDTSRAPLCIIGTAGAGKSAVMAKSAHDAVVSAKKGELPLPE